MCARQALSTTPSPSLLYLKTIMKTIFLSSSPVVDMGLHTQEAEALRCRLYKGVLEGAVRCLRWPPDLETRSSDTMHSAGRTENGTEEKDQARPHSSKTALSYVTSFTTVLISDLTLRTTGLCREEQQRPQERGWAALGKAWNFLSCRLSGWSLETPYLETLALLSGLPCSPVWTLSKSLLLSPSLTLSCQAPHEPSRLDHSQRSDYGW